MCCKRAYQKLTHHDTKLEDHDTRRKICKAPASVAPQLEISITPLLGDLSKYFREANLLSYTVLLIFPL